MLQVGELSYIELNGTINPNPLIKNAGIHLFKLKFKTDTTSAMFILQCMGKHIDHVDG